MKHRETSIEALERALKEDGRALCTIVSDSMVPLLPVGTQIEVIPARPPYRRFDVVVFREVEKDRLVCHYVWHCNDLPSAHGRAVYVTRPLNPKLAAHEDLPLEESMILGRVVSHALSARQRTRVVLRDIARSVGWRFGARF